METILSHEDRRRILLAVHAGEEACDALFETVRSSEEAVRLCRALIQTAWALGPEPNVPQ